MKYKINIIVCIKSKFQIRLKFFVVASINIEIIEKSSFIQNNCVGFILSFTYRVNCIDVLKQLKKKKKKE